MDETSSKILKDLGRRIGLVRGRQGRVDFLAGILLFGTAAIVTSLLLLAAESLGDLSRMTRTVLFVLVSVSAATAAVWMLGRPLLRWLGSFSTIPDEKTAKRIGAFYPAIRDRLINALQLAKDAHAAAHLYSIELLDASLKTFENEIRPIDFTQSVDVSRLPRYRRWLTASAIAALLLVFVFPSAISDASFRLVHFTREFSPPAQFTFQITPGDKEIVKGEDVDVHIIVVPLRPAFVPRSAALTVFRQAEGQENVDEVNLKPDSSGSYGTKFLSLRTTTEYYVEYNGAQSTPHLLRVVDRPLIRSLRLRLDYPAYTGIASKTLDDFMGDVSAPKGARYTISISVSKPIKKIVRLYGDGGKDSTLFDTERTSATLPTVVLSKDNSYHISVVDHEGLLNKDPIEYHLKVVPDEYPTIAILEPGRNIDIAGDQSLRVPLHAQDDYGVSRLRLGYRLIHSQYEPAHADYAFVPIPVDASAGGDIQLSYIWNLAGLHLAPEDVVEYFAEVLDNDAVSGPKSGHSPLYLLRLPSLDEVFADVDQEHERSIGELKSSLDQANKLKEDIESINRDLKKNRDPDWQTQKKVEEMAKKYENVRKNLEDVRARVDQMTQQMQQQNVLSKETLEKYLELQQLFQQLDAAGLQDVLKQLQGRMPSMSKEQLQQAMQNMTFSEEQFRQNIERTMNLLKRIQIEQKLDEVKKRSQELEKAEKDIQSDSSAAPGAAEAREELARKQADLAKKEQTMEHEAADLQKRMEEFFTEMPADQMQKSLQHLQQQQLDSKMAQASQQMRTGSMQSAGRMQQQIGDQLRQFSQQMDAMQQQMLQQQSQYVISEMRKATNNLLELSKNEESLKDGSRNAPQNSPQLHQNAEGQEQAVQDLNNVIKGLSALSQKSFAVTPEMGKAIGEALARMNNALRALETRNGAMASQEQGQAMASLNRAAMQVQNALQSMMQSGNGGTGSLMQQLQLMAGQQMSINAQTQRMSGMSQEQGAEAARLAKEQGTVQKSLEELNREAQETGEQKRLLGDLQRIADEMKEVVRDLEQNNANPETIKRQERILSRMLDASKSMHERDFEKKRKSETGTQFTRRSPKDLNVNSAEGSDRLREELLKALEQGYSKDYQDLIRKYLEELEKSEKSVY